jgi:hypothetical protein
MSMTFRVSDDADTLYTHRLTDLCHYLTARVLRPFFGRHGVAWEHHWGDFFRQRRGTNPFEATGTIEFCPPLMFAGQLGELENLIRDALAQAGVRTGPFVHAPHPDGLAVEVVQIQVTENPTALYGPPEVNMSNSAACLILRDLLGYQPRNGQFEFAPEDLLQRVAAVTQAQIDALSIRPLKDKRANTMLRAPSIYTMKRIQRCLEELKRYGEWALRHDHHQLMAA